MNPLSPGELASPFDLAPISGPRVRTGRGPLVIAFLRALGGGNARAAVRALNTSFAQFDADGIGVVGFTRTTPEVANDFVPRHHVLFPIVNDPEGRWFDAYGVRRDRALVRSLVGLGPAAARRAITAVWEGRSRPEDPDRLPAYLVLARDGTVSYARYGATIWEQPDVPRLLAEARRAATPGGAARAGAPPPR
jgi:peroxiredoxin